MQKQGSITLPKEHNSSPDTDPDLKETYEMPEKIQHKDPNVIQWVAREYRHTV